MLQASFPGVNFTVVNAARGASDVIVASTCWYQYAPQDADLVLVEYSLNGCLDFGGIPMCSSTAMLRVAHYESLYRRLLRRAPRAALMSVAAFAFAAETKVQGAASVTVPNAFRSTGQELHGMIARRYGAPMASIRDSLYSVIYNDAASQQLLGTTRAALMADTVHPNAAGFRVWGDIVAYTGAGQALSISLDTSLAAAVGSSSDRTNSASSTATQFERRYLAVTYLQGSSIPVDKMGAATLACVRGCRCKTVQLGWRVDTNTGIAATEVSLHPSCLVSITVAANATTGGDDFAVTGVAVVPFSKAAQVSWIDAVDMAAASAAGGQLPYSWP
ncbi:hypothetical protein OEZ86_012384 [Tetradesmus obliquus]|nr:hypothetical protein OEZ86_012384 [Tetradesmus obliquus]